MKHIALLIIIVLQIGLLTNCHRNSIPDNLIPTFDKILENPIKVQEYYFTIHTPYKAVPIDFSSKNILDTSFMRVINNFQITYIQYVYTSYKKDDGFKQEELNRERLFQLYKIKPSLFDSGEIIWSTYVQEFANTEEMAKENFHGFVVYYKPSPTKKLMQEEISFIRRKIDSSSFYTLSENIMGTQLPIAASESISIHGIFSDSARKVYGKDSGFATTKTDFDFSRINRDTVVAAVLNRNYNWKKMLVCCDLTGSMSPYSTQLFLWHKLNLVKSKIQHFVFFNDGDFTPDNKKKTGKTGGLYYTKADDFDKLLITVDKCMSNGGGGDSPENDIEAILYGIKKCSGYKDIILIADNWANMRDYSLIHKINQPVKIILCGTQFGINTQYLDLARATKGSIHTIEEDISSLMNMKEGEEISIGQETFKIEKGKFILIRRK